MNVERTAKYLAQNHPQGSLWILSEGRPAFPDEWEEWKKWSDSEKILYFLALNLWNGFVDLSTCPLDPAQILKKLDRKQINFIKRAWEEGEAYAMA